LFDLEIEKTAKANQKATRLAYSGELSFRAHHTEQIIFERETVTAPVIKMGELPPQRQPLMGGYGLPVKRGHLTHVFQPAKPVATDIKRSV